MSNGKQITKKQSTDLGYLKVKNDEDLGTENIDQSDLLIPRLKVVQAMTKDKAGADDGDFLNSGDGKSYGKAVQIIPIIHAKSRINFKNMDIQCRSMDGKVASVGSLIGKEAGSSCEDCEFAQWDDNEKPKCSQIFNYYVALRSELQAAMKTQIVLPPLTLSFMSGSIKVARKINTAVKLNASKRLPIYSQVFILSTPVDPIKTSKGTWFPIELRIGNYISKEEAEYLRGLYSEMKKVKLDTTKTITQEDVKEDEV